MPPVPPEETTLRQLNGLRRAKPPWSAARVIYTGLGLGLAPKAPGTFGTLLGLPLYFLMIRWGWPLYLLGTVFICGLGLWAGNRAEFDLDRHDAPEVVIDEVAGYLVTMFLAPALPWIWVWGFVFFRLFDILKPWPVSWADRRLAGSLGVMLDDVLAGVYAWLALRLVATFLY